MKTDRRAYHALMLCVLALLPLKSNALMLTEYSIEANTAAAAEDFSWNIASTLDGNTTPNILSELSWKDLEMNYLGFKLAARTEGCIGFEFGARFGNVTSGQVQDSDYAGDDRTGEFSRSLSDTGGNRSELNLGSYCLKYTSLFPARLLLTVKPEFGFVYSSQRRNMVDGLQIIGGTQVTIHGSTITVPAEGTVLADLNSHHITEWAGPYFGLGFALDLNRNLSIYTAAKAYVTDYYAKADWNLREDFAHPVSFEHKATGYGYDLSNGIQLNLQQRLQINLEHNYRYWQTGDGIDRTYVVQDGELGVGRTRLNGTFWRHTEWVFKMRMLF